MISNPGQPTRSVPNTRHCAFCEAPLPHHTPHAIKHCDALACRQAWQRQNLRDIQCREKEAEAQLKYRLEQFRARQSLQLRIPTTAIAIVKVPHNDSTAIPVDAERRDAFAEHLAQLVATLDQVYTETAFKPEHDTPLAPHLGEVLGEGCNTCRGFCCLQGEQYHAFIQRSTLIRALESDPSLAAETIVEHYLSHIPARAMEGGCVYQTETGCCLPGELRANICHEFFCDGLHRFVKENARRVPDYSLIIATDNSEPKAAHRISGQGEVERLNINEVRYD